MLQAQPTLGVCFLSQPYFVALVVILVFFFYVIPANDEIRGDKNVPNEWKSHSRLIRAQLYATELPQVFTYLGGLVLSNVSHLVGKFEIPYTLRSKRFLL